MTGFGGEFHDLGDGKPTSWDWEARAAFLQAIRKLVPDVLRSLQTDVLPRYIEARPVPNPLFYMDDEREAFLTFLQGKPPNPLIRPEPVLPPFEGLRDSLFAWADRFHLREDWVLDTALDTLARWHYNPQAAGNDWGTGRHPLWDRLVMWPVDRDLSQCSDSEKIYYEAHRQYEPDPFVFKKLAWICYVEQRSEYEERAREAFDEELTRYLDEIEQAAEARGWKRAPKLRHRKAEPIVSFEILARWQCGGATKKQLVTHVDSKLSLDSINDRLKQAASIVGIELRKGRDGRPPKS